MKNNYVRLLGVAAMLMLCAVSCRNDLRQKDKIILNKEQFMVLYKNGYLKGYISAQKKCLNLPSDSWETDSLFIDNAFNACMEK